MSEYKRLTERYIDKQGTNCVRGLAWDGEILHRLAELEDKIENRTLVVVNKPFYSDQFNAWCMYLKEGDYIISALLTKKQADSKLKELQEKQK